MGPRGGGGRRRRQGSRGAPHCSQFVRRIQVSIYQPPSRVRQCSCCCGTLGPQVLVARLSRGRAPASPGPSGLCPGVAGVAWLRGCAVERAGRMANACWGAVTTRGRARGAGNVNRPPSKILPGFPPRLSRKNFQKDFFSFTRNILIAKIRQIAGTVMLKAFY